ncbi:hypothetical protein BV20DRAFT_962839 [Pilatotrama ljubarskyi]|nr:hypothetical protein BV20DRAFT_962839 [Pilatotrama ljubarskyi]
MPGLSALARASPLFILATTTARPTSSYVQSKARQYKMSNSIRSYCGSICYSSDSVRGDSKAVKDGWESEVEGRILEYPDSTDYFIEDLLPTSTPFKLNDNLDDAFNTYDPQKGKEVDGYKGLLCGLRTLVKGFEKDRKLSFVDTHAIRMYFPFNAFRDQHHYTYPDISVSFPGQPLSPTTWHGISMVIEVKSDASDDPFPRSGLKNTSTVVQLAKNARSLLLAHGFLSAFTIGVYGNIVRLARFDRSCAIVSKSIDLNDAQGRRVLQKFLWHFSHPAAGETVVGCDPTVARLDAAGQEWVRTQLENAKAKDREKHVRELDKARRVEVYDQKTGKSVPYILYHLVDVNGRLFSRATTVWRALKDTRILENGKLVDDPTCTAPAKPQIAKEAWRQLARRSEAEIYERIEEKIPRKERFGLPTMVCGGDMGSRELRWWEETRRRQDTHADNSRSDSASDAAGPSTFGDPSEPVTLDLPSEDFPLPYPQQQTYSWRLLYAEDGAHLERSHMRIVVDDVGRPLTQFTCTRELVQAVRDAIFGHRQARERAQVLHRDVSVGNILIVDEPKDKGFGGFLHDYDYSSIELEDEDEAYETGRPSTPLQTAEDEHTSSRKERTGTYYFMAFEILRGCKLGPVMHLIRHDLESFYWVLIWVVLRHTRHDHPQGQLACTEVFGYTKDAFSSAMKRDWATEQIESPLSVPGNAPLTQLLRDLARMVCQNIPHPLHTPVHLTYDRMLQAFDAALAMENWPEKDFVRCELLDFRTVSQVWKQPTESGCPSGARPESRESRAIAISGGSIQRLQGGARSAPPDLDLDGVAVQASTAPVAGASTTATSCQLRSSSKRPRLPEAVQLHNRGSSSNKRLKASGDMGPPAIPVVRSHPARILGGGRILASRRSRERGSVPPTRSSERIRAAAERKTTSGSGS